MATQKEQEAGNEDYAAQFNTESVQKAAQTDDEAFGLSAEGDAGTAGAGAEEQPGAPVAAPAPAEADDKAKALQAREDGLKTREQELDARAASIQTSNTNEVQTSSAAEGEGGGDAEGDVESGDAAKDPRAALAEDFGPEFVTLLEAFIKDVANGSVTDQIGSLHATVQSVIDGLQTERNQAHFKTIAAQHEDFMDIVESPAFNDWLAGLQEADKAAAEKVVQEGSAQEIIDMLTKFKASKTAPGGAVDEGALDDAEGVRSVGLRLPAEPHASEDYAAAWNAA